ncbi:hypothetical protein Bca4012_039966 [Brassica carinata]
MHPGVWLCPRNRYHCCIYRVPNSIREVKPEAYTPQLVLIGPLHHALKSQALKALGRGDDITFTKSMGYLNMEERKMTYVGEFAARLEGEMIINGFENMIREEEETIRASYSESTAWIESPEFVEMVLIDSVFIIEFMLKQTECDGSKIGDPLFDDLCLVNTVKDDLILLENQLPYLFLEKLFETIVPRISQNQTLRELTINFFGLRGQIGDNSRFLHFTDLIRCVRVETLPRNDIWEARPIEHMYNADKLDRGGVKFKAVEEFSLNVRFENGCLEMPCLTVMDKLELTLRNIMALEQCHYPFNAHVCNFVLFLDHLIDTDKDVDLLVEKGIIQNCLGQPTSVSRMVNKLGLGIGVFASYYSDIGILVNEYYRNPVNRSKAVLMRVYFGDLWTGTATIAASLLLVMTLIQTWASIT